MLEKIRNFCVIAHIDHGKSTLADRLLEITGTVEKRRMQEQMLDQMDLERERGITIKLAPVRIDWHDYILNLIDTPGHVDFTYEVSRSLAACEGALLLVDATQGIQAQTIANLYLALDNNLTVIPVINKIDLPNADVKKVEAEIKSILGGEEILKISAKTGEGVDKILQAVIDRIVAPAAGRAETRGLIFDSIYDTYQGVVAYVRLKDGEIKVGDKLKLFATDTEVEVLEVGVFRPQKVKRDKLMTGEVGYVVTGLKEIVKCKVGDTLASLGVKQPLKGYKKIQPMVFASFYPEDADKYFELREALGKLNLNDASLTFEPESSLALGRGFRCGFLGLLHLEIIQERLKREFDMALTITTPSVSYKIKLRSGEEQTIYSPAELPDPSFFSEIREPWVMMDIVVPANYLGRVMDLAQKYRGDYKNTEYLDVTRAILHYEMPLAAIITDFFDNLKAVSEGYASLNYDFKEYRTYDLVRLDIMVGGDKVDAFSRVVPRDEVTHEGLALVKRLKEVIPQQMFQIALQAAVGGRIIARENIRAMRKDVTAKLYGGDVTRKVKLLEKQKKGKKKMMATGKVKIPQDVFLAILKKK